MAKVLIVDDKASNLFALENVLRQLKNVEVIKASSGNEALRATLSHDFALAILDVQMPVMDGYELAGLMRSDSKTRSIPIIFLSAVYFEEPYVFKGYESGAVDFITKPFRSEVLLSKVGIFLELAEQRAELEAQLEARKRAEDQIRKAHDSLEEKVQARTAELKNEIEERKRVEEQIRLDEARFEALYNLTQMTEVGDREVIAFVLEAQLKITKSRVGLLALISDDGKTCVIHGWSRTVMKECGITDEPMHFPVEGGGLWAKAVREGRPVIVNDYSAPHPAKKGYPKGHIELSRIMSVPLFDGETAVAIGVVGNKEEEYNTSDARQLALLMDGMWKLLKRREIEETRRTYMARLEQSNRELEDFAFVASHDLQEPLRKIRTFSDRLRKTYCHSLDDNGRDYLERMQRSAARMQDLILDLLEYSRVTIKPEPFGPVSLKRLVEEAVMDLRVLCEETGGMVEIGELPSIEADGVQIRRLFQNLIGNGLKYCGDRKPVIKVYSESLCSDEYWRIKVEDNGIGFDECYLEKIFKPFQRLHGKNSIYHGTGMGLAICRRIVERHGGSITARSESGKGATFIVTLPASQRKSERAPL